MPFRECQFLVLTVFRTVKRGINRPVLLCDMQDELPGPIISHTALCQGQNLVILSIRRSAGRYQLRGFVSRTTKEQVILCSINFYINLIALSGAG